MLVLCAGLLLFCGTAFAQDDRGAVAAYVSVFPDTKSIGIVYSDKSLEGRIDLIKKDAEEKKIKVIISHAPTIKEFPQALRDLKDKADTIWVLDDPLYSVADAWKYFILFTLRAQIKTVVPNEKSLSQGGLFFYTEEKEALINKRVLDIMGLKVESEGVPIKYYGEN